MNLHGLPVYNVAARGTISGMATRTTLDMLAPTRIRYGVLLFVYVAAFITYLDRVCLSVAPPAMQADLGLPQVLFAWVFTVFYIAYTVFEIPTSSLGDRWAQRLMLVRIVGSWTMFRICTRLSHVF